jgi:DNA mismatch repair protein MutL
MPIRLLPPAVASQIAAGEVIERPASVVKELLENALDAGASFITIKTEGGGQELVEVADDGYGIPADEIILAVERHATSKLVNSDDLFHIKTLGFRGEALASIGSVSRLLLTSRTRSQEVGARLVVEGGSSGSVSPVGAPSGTVVRVEDLFYNVPARRKFLKNPGTERRVIDELVTRYALAYPKVRFHLFQEGRPSLQTSGNDDRREVLAALYGVEVARQMLEVLAEEPNLHITGFISPPALTRSNRREIVFFVNGRPVQDASLIAALLKGYQTLLMVGRYPLGVLFLELPSDAVDVNVHPTKAEVRFREPDRMFTGVQRGVRHALLAHSPVPGIEPGIRWAGFPTEGSRQERPGLDAYNRPFDGGYEKAAPQKPVELSGDPYLQASAATSPQAGWSAMQAPILRLVGQIANTYLVAEGPDGLYLIDQHAAHERVLFERFRTQQKLDPASSLPSQALLQPVTVNLPASSARLLDEQLPFLECLGFHVEAFGSNTFLVRSVPLLLEKSDPGAALRVLVEDFEEDETPLQAEREARLIARICKRAAIKGGQPMTPVEQAGLLKDLEGCTQPRTCPHGRPTMIHLSVDLLERQFGRRGAR